MSEENLQPENGAKKKTGLFAIIVILIVAIAVVAVAFFYMKSQKEAAAKDAAAKEAAIRAEENIVTYAPADTNLIIYINGQKISQNKVWKAWRESCKDDFAKAEKECTEKGADLNEILNSKLAIFAYINVQDLEQSAVAGVVKFHDKVAGKYLDLLAKEADGKEDHIAKKEFNGKPGLEGKDGDLGASLVVADDSMLMFQLTSAKKYSGDTAILQKSNAAIAGKIDVDSMLGIAFDSKDIASNKNIKRAIQDLNAEELIDGLQFITLEVKEAGNNIVTQAVLTYENEKQAATSAETIKSFILLGKKTVGSDAKKKNDKALQDLEKSLEKIVVDVHQATIVISSSEDMDGLIANVKGNTELVKSLTK